jgi:hypothetical protein
MSAQTPIVSDLKSRLATLKDNYLKKNEHSNFLLLPANNYGYLPKVIMS